MITQQVQRFAMRGQFGSALTGTIAATTNGTLLTVRYPEISAARWGAFLKILRMHVQVTTLTAFTTPVTASRGLKLVRAAHDAAGTANPSGGGAFTFGLNRPGTADTLAIGRVATTGALTTTGFTFETAVKHRMSLTHAGASGAVYDEVWRFDDVEAPALWLPPGYLVGLQTEGALDAGGTIQVQVEIDAVETDR